MFKLFLIKKLSKHKNNIKMEKSAAMISPFIVLSGVLIILSYILDMSLGEQINHGIVSSLPTRVFSSLGKLIRELIFPVISISVAYTISGLEAIFPALLGGVMAVSGYSFLSPEGSIASVSGIFGVIIIGLLSGYSLNMAKKIFSKLKESACDFLCVIFSMIFVALFTLSFNTLSGISSDSSSMILLYAENKSEILPFLLLPYFVNLNPGGTSYVTAYSFASAMLRSEQGTASASVFVSSVVPVVAMGIYCVIFLKKNHNPIALAGISGLGLSIGGVHITPLLMYITNPVRSVLCFTTGSLLSSVLCYLFSCKVRAFEGGFFAAELMEKPLTLIFVILSGAALSTLMLLLTERKSECETED